MKIQDENEYIDCILYYYIIHTDPLNESKKFASYIPFWAWYFYFIPKQRIIVSETYQLDILHIFISLKTHGLTLSHQVEKNAVGFLTFQLIRWFWLFHTTKPVEQHFGCPMDGYYGVIVYYNSLSKITIGSW